LCRFIVEFDTISKIGTKVGRRLDTIQIRETSRNRRRGASRAF
jgi:hypothetical protein